MPRVFITDKLEAGGVNLLGWRNLRDGWSAHKPQARIALQDDHVAALLQFLEVLVLATSKFGPRIGTADAIGKKGDFFAQEIVDLPVQVHEQRVDRDA